MNKKDKIYIAGHRGMVGKRLSQAFEKRRDLKILYSELPMNLTCEISRLLLIFLPKKNLVMFF
jgi:hypothetical protein